MTHEKTIYAMAGDELFLSGPREIQRMRPWEPSSYGIPNMFKTHGEMRQALWDAAENNEEHEYTLVTCHWSDGKVGYALVMGTKFDVLSKEETAAHIQKLWGISSKDAFLQGLKEA
jgi:hypothetical protein